MDQNTSYKTFLKEQLLTEHSKAQTMRIVHWIGRDADRLAAHMALFLGDEYRITQRGAWVVRYVAEANPDMMSPWIPILVERLRAPGHDAVKRNILNVFEAISTPDEHIGFMADTCFQFLANPAEAIAIRCAAMSILEEICQKEPGLAPELKLLLTEIQEEDKPGIKSRARRILSKL